MEGSNRNACLLFYYGAMAARKSCAVFILFQTRRKKVVATSRFLSIDNYLHGKEMELTSLTISSETNQLKKVTLPSFFDCGSKMITFGYS